MAWSIGKLFGLGGSDEAGKAAKENDPVEYQGYQIAAAPQPQGGQWLTAGVIRKTFPEGVKEHRFVRADVYASRDDAAACAVTKAQRIIDEQMDGLFDGGR